MTLLNGAQKIPFADFHAALAQQGIDHAGMEVKIRQHKIIDVAERGEFPHAVGNFNSMARASSVETFAAVTVFK